MPTPPYGSQVYKGMRRGVHEVAVKQLGNLKDPQLIRQFRKEIAILGRVSFQPNIVNFYGACLRNPDNIMLVMELMEGAEHQGTLHDASLLPLVPTFSKPAWLGPSTCMSWLIQRLLQASFYRQQNCQSL